MREVLGNFQWRVRAFVLLLLDIIAMGVASFLALWVQSEFVFSDIGTDVLRSVYGYMPFNVVITVAIFALFHLYTSLWKYASVNELVKCRAGSIDSRNFELDCYVDCRCGRTKELSDFIYYIFRNFSCRDSFLVSICALYAQ